MPPPEENEEKAHQAYFLNIIVWILIFIPPIYYVYIIVAIPQEAPRALTQALFTEVINGVILYLLQRKYIDTAAMVQISALWIFFTVSAVTGLGVSGQSYLLGYPLVIMVTGILKKWRVVVGITALSLASGWAMAYTESQGYFLSGHTSMPIKAWVSSLIIFPMGAILQMLAKRTLQNALKRAYASEERYKLISAVSTDYIYSSDVTREGKVNLVWVAGAFEKMTGYTVEEYKAAGGWTKNIHPDDLEKDDQDMQTLFKNENVVNSNIRIFTKSGEIRWERIFAHPIWSEEKNRLIKIVGAVQDITLQKQSEERLKEILLQQTAILNNIPDMAWLKNKNGQYVAVNEQFAKSAGKTIEEITGKTDFEIWDMEFANSYHQDDLEVIQSRQRKCTEEIQMDSSGRKYWIETTKTPILDEKGVVVGTTGIAREITERKKAEMERETLIAELEAKNAELERYTYTVSHDLKSPLVTIRGFLGYLEKDALTGNTKKIKDDINRIDNAAQKMYALLNDLLELSRIGRIINEPTEMLFTDVVQDAIDLVSGQIKEKNINIQIQNTPARIYGDRMRLTEAIQNLTDNAIKFMGNQPQPHISIGAVSSEKNETVFFVSDNGVGIEKQYHERIFTLFSKLNAETEGTGIGLTLVKRIIEVHKGSIWLESRAGKGTTFYFTLNQT